MERHKNGQNVHQGLWERQHVWSMLADKITSLLMAYRSAEWIYWLALSLAITWSATQKQINLNNADVHQCVNIRIKTEQLSKTLFKGAASHPASKTIFISLKYPLVQAYLLLRWIYSRRLFAVNVTQFLLLCFCWLSACVGNGHEICAQEHNLGRALRVGWNLWIVPKRPTVVKCRYITQHWQTKKTNSWCTHTPTVNDKLQNMLPRTAGLQSGGERHTAPRKRSKERYTHVHACIRTTNIPEWARRSSLR